MYVLRVGLLPQEALAASAHFHAEILPRIRALAPQHVALVFAPADHTHRDWRVAVVRQLARSMAPHRINALASDDEAAIAAALRYLESADGITGQYLPLDVIGAGVILRTER